MAPPPVESLLEQRTVLICCGSGGVGKTTSAATLALAGALRGRRACVVTVDPARRLADALGLTAIGNEARRIELDAPGELWAVMLDAKGTFDDLVRRYSSDAEQAERILANRLYRNLVGALSGTQEYMATEKLYELYEQQRFDLIVVDTPPTRNALDFLDAPRRLTGFLDNRLFRLLIAPGRSYLRAMGMAAQLLLRTLAKVAGSEIVEDTIAFFQAFEGMEAGFRERARRVEELLADRATGFVLVAAPRRESVAEAGFLATRLGGAGHEIDLLVVNRVLSSFAGEEASAEALALLVPNSDGALDHAPGPAALAELEANLAELASLAAAEQRLVDELAIEHVNALVKVPELGSDVHDLGELGALARYLLGAAPAEVNARRRAH